MKQRNDADLFHLDRGREKRGKQKQQGLQEVLEIIGEGRDLNPVPAN